MMQNNLPHRVDLTNIDAKKEVLASMHDKVLLFNE